MTPEVIDIKSGYAGRRPSADTLRLKRDKRKPSDNTEESSRIYFFCKTISAARFRFATIGKEPLNPIRCLDGSTPSGPVDAIGWSRLPKDLKLIYQPTFIPCGSHSFNCRIARHLTKAVKGSRNRPRSLRLPAAHPLGDNSLEAVAQL